MSKLDDYDSKYNKTTWKKKYVIPTQTINEIKPLSSADETFQELLLNKSIKKPSGNSGCGCDNDAFTTIDNTIDKNVDEIDIIHKKMSDIKIKKKKSKTFPNKMYNDLTNVYDTPPITDFSNFDPSTPVSSNNDFTYNQNQNPIINKEEQEPHDETPSIIQENFDNKTKNKKVNIVDLIKSSWEIFIFIVKFINSGFYKYTLYSYFLIDNLLEKYIILPFITICIYFSENIIKDNTKFDDKDKNNDVEVIKSVIYLLICYPLAIFAMCNWYYLLIIRKDGEKGPTEINYDINLSNVFLKVIVDLSLIHI